MKVAFFIGLTLCLSFSVLKSQDSTSILRLEYENMLKQENYFLGQINEVDYKNRCLTKRIYKLESPSSQRITQNIANQVPSLSKTMTLQDSVSQLNIEVDRLRRTLIKREREPVNHFGRTLTKFDLDVCPCSSLTNKRPEIETMLFTFFKEHNRYLLDLNTSTQFRKLSPYNIPNDALFWCIPTKFYLIKQLEPIDNVQNGSVKVSDLQNAFQDGTVKFTRIRRIAK